MISRRLVVPLIAAAGALAAAAADAHVGVSWSVTIGGDACREFTRTRKVGPWPTSGLDFRAEVHYRAGRRSSVFRATRRAGEASILGAKKRASAD